MSAPRAAEACKQATEIPVMDKFTAAVLQLASPNSLKKRLTKTGLTSKPDMIPGVMSAR